MCLNFDLNMTVTLPQDFLYLFLKQFEGKELGLLHSFPHFDKHYLNSYKHVGLTSKKSHSRFSRAGDLGRSLLTGGRCSEVAVSTGLTVYHFSDFL
jgi:hypothetical protein